MSEITATEILNTLFEVLSGVQKAFEIELDEMLELIRKLSTNAKSSSKDLFTYIYDWVKLVMSGKSFYQRERVMKGSLIVLNV